MAHSYKLPFPWEEPCILTLSFNLDIVVFSYLSIDRLTFRKVFKFKIYSLAPSLSSVQSLSNSVGIQASGYLKGWASKMMISEW